MYNSITTLLSRTDDVDILPINYIKPLTLPLPTPVSLPPTAQTRRQKPTPPPPTFSPSLSPLPHPPYQESPSRTPFATLHIPTLNHLVDQPIKISYTFIESTGGGRIRGKVFLLIGNGRRCRMAMGAGVGMGDFYPLSDRSAQKEV